MDQQQFRGASTTLKIISLGGFGRVTTNMFVYEYGNDILLVDCGIGFPSEEMLGVDLLIPDISYLRPKMKNIRGLILTHGHEDHVGGLPYILPQLPNIPIYGSRLTTGLVEGKLAEFSQTNKVTAIPPEGSIRLGGFTIEPIRITHSIPDAYHYLITTGAGTVYHGSDFKFDWTPIDSQLPQIDRIVRLSDRGVTLLLSDCLRSEKAGFTPSERTLSEMFEREISLAKGKFMLTTMSSNISRLQQAIDTSAAHHRRVCLVGRSIEKNVETATRLGFMKIPKDILIRQQQVKRYPDSNITLLVAGSQAQSGSAMERIALGEHKFIRLTPQDRVVFSTDYIPGNEDAIHNLIDIITKVGVAVSYAEVASDLHVSGHGASGDLMLLAALVRPRSFLPIGGTFRHMVQYAGIIEAMGYSSKQILLPNPGDTINISGGRTNIGGHVDVRDVMVDGLGVGDVGNVVLRDRQVLAEEGIVVVVVQLDQGSNTATGEVDIISRGFVYSAENKDLIEEAKNVLRQALAKHRSQLTTIRLTREVITEVLEPFLFEKTRRRPMVLPVIVEA
jgi:ribonuclease J